MPPIRSPKVGKKKGKAPATFPRKRPSLPNDPCKFCKRVFKRRNELFRHIKTHGDEAVKLPCPWPDCIYKAWQRSNLDTHYYTHTKEKPHSCTECNFKAGDRSSLTRHRKRHQKQRQGYNTQTSVEHKYENLKPDKYVFVHVVSGLEVGPASVAEGMTRVEQLEPVPDSGYASNKDPSARPCDASEEHSRNIAGPGYQADIHWYPSPGSHLANPSQVLTNGRMTATSQEHAVFDSATIRHTTMCVPPPQEIDSPDQQRVTTSQLFDCAGSLINHMNGPYDQEVVVDWQYLMDFWHPFLVENSLPTTRGGRYNQEVDHLQPQWQSCMMDLWHLLPVENSLPTTSLRSGQYDQQLEDRPQWDLMDLWHPSPLSAYDQEFVVDQPQWRLEYPYDQELVVDWQYLVDHLWHPLAVPVENSPSTTREPGTSGPTAMVIPGGSHIQSTDLTYMYW